LRAEIGLDVIEALRARSRILAADAQGFLRVQRDTKLVHAPWSDTRGVLRQLDVLKTDALEAESLTGQRDMVRAARLLSDRGPREVVITHREGVLALADGIYHEAGFFPERVVGRSGRGDTCLAAYVARRLTHSPEDATAWAAAVTSLKLEAEGPFRRDLRAVESLIRERYQGRGSSLCDS
jgi:sugar/nucleoside kinase (ribokinase family)